MAVVVATTAMAMEARACAATAAAKNNKEQVNLRNREAYRPVEPLARTESESVGSTFQKL